MRPFARLLVAATITAMTLVEPRADACATAPPEGATVAVAEESAIIVWDEATKTEHFIRRASFQSASKDFGFLVPTPTKPEIAEAPDDAFRLLDDAIRPEVVYRDQWFVEPTVTLFFWFSRSASAPAGSAEAPAVRVLEEKRVGDYDTAILEADDAGALAEWLTSHGYAKRPALMEWLVPYVEKKWKLTAFKIAGDAPGGGPPGTLGTRAVRMSFKTERPFFPYREPRDQRESLPPSLSTKRSLRVFFLGPARVAAAIGDGSTAFAGKTTWAAPFKDGSAALPVLVPAGAWLTAIEDDASPRPGVDELWLDRSKDPAVVKPPTKVLPNWRKIPLPLDLVALGTVIVVVVVRRRQRRARDAERRDQP